MCSTAILVRFFQPHLFCSVHHVYIDGHIHVSIYRQRFICVYHIYVFRMETYVSLHCAAALSMLLAICVGKPLITCRFPLQRASNAKLLSMVSRQKDPTRHAYAWQIGPFWQDTLVIIIDFMINYSLRNYEKKTYSTLLPECYPCWWPGLAQLYQSFGPIYLWHYVGFLWNPHNRLPIAHPLGQAMGCLLWVQSQIYVRADSRFVPSQWETLLRSNAISHWLGCKPRISPVCSAVIAVLYVI